jgi:hypothetical protein
MVPTKAYTNSYPRSATTAPDSPTSHTSSSSGTSYSSRPTTPPAWANPGRSVSSSPHSTCDGDYSVALTDSPNSQATSVKSAPEIRQELIDNAREREARMRSHKMFEDIILRDAKKDTGSSSHRLRHSTTSTSQLTASQAAARRSQIAERERTLVKGQLKDGKALLAKSGTGRLKPAPIQPLSQAHKKLAESTRRPRAITADDVRDPETIAGMKCQMDWDRQKWAEKKALSLLESGIWS